MHAWLNEFIKNKADDGDVRFSFFSSKCGKSNPTLYYIQIAILIRVYLFSEKIRLAGAKLW